MEASLERMPSSAESESAFSAATEAESEMTDGGFEDADIRTEYFLSYPTDCLSAYELIKKRSLHGVRALDDVSATVIAICAIAWGGGASVLEGSGRGLWRHYVSTINKSFRRLFR